MAFAARQPQAQPTGTEENAMAGKEARGLAAAKAGAGLLQQGSKRRAPLGDMSNLAGSLNGRQAGAKDAASTKVVAEAVKPRVPASRVPAQPKDNITTGTESTATAVAVAPAAAAAPRPVAIAPPRTRSQTAAARQHAHGPSMSSLLASRSEAATASKKSSASMGTASVPSAPPPSPLPAIDTATDHANPLAATEYVNDIFSYFRRVEPKFRVKAGYMSVQTDINERMRAILIDWLVEVHLKFKLMPETLNLTVNLIDRFLEAKAVTRKNLQLVGVTAMLIASKYEEIWAPEVRDFVYISDKAYSREQILAMEKLMLNTLQFNLTLPTAHNFLARFIKAAGNDRKVLCLATYLSELALVDAGMLAYSYSMISTAALHVALAGLGEEDAYPHALARHSGYSRAAIAPCAKALVRLMQKAPTNSLSAVFKKYSAAKQMEVASIEPPVALLEEPETSESS